MAQNCNAIIPFEPNTLEAKAALGRSASIALHAALSDCFKAIETLETRQASTGAEVVYLRAATGQLETTVQALRGMREILETGSLSSEASAWLERLDYDRLYESGTSRRLIPAD